jgi:DNA-binding PadR family transcriptional regulator
LPSAILALLSERPMHPYRIQQCIRQRNKHEVINVSQRAAVYQAIRRLEREGLIRAQSVTRDEKRPERTTYELTDAGRADVEQWLRKGLSSPLKEFPEFPAVLSFIEHLSPEEALEALRKRIQALDAEEKRLARDYDEFLKQVPRLFLVESEYLRAVCRAEKIWVESIVSDIEAGKLVWSAESIKAIRAKLPDADG